MKLCRPQRTTSQEKVALMPAVEEICGVPVALPAIRLRKSTWHSYRSPWTGYVDEGGGLRGSLRRIPGRHCE